MDNLNDILDPKIKEWVDNYDYQLDSNKCLALAEDVSLKVANELVLSIIRKVGTIEGIRKANEILTSLNIDTEIELSPLIKEINVINELELKILALKTCNLSKISKNKILNKYIEKFGNSENKKQESIVDLLKQEVNKVYKNLGELPSPRIDDVNLVKDQKPLATRPVKPFGKKDKK